MAMRKYSDIVNANEPSNHPLVESLRRQMLTRFVQLERELRNSKRSGNQERVEQIETRELPLLLNVSRSVGKLPSRARVKPIMIHVHVLNFPKAVQWLEAREFQRPRLQQRAAALRKFLTRVWERDEDIPDDVFEIEIGFRVTVAT